MDSNQQPTDYESAALTVVLRALCVSAGKPAGSSLGLGDPTEIVANGRLCDHPTILLVCEA